MMKTRGLTIIELLVGLFITFVAVCMLAAVMVSTYNFFHKTEDRAELVQLTRLNMEDNFYWGCTTQFTSYPGFKCGINTSYTALVGVDPRFAGQINPVTATVANTTTGASLQFETGCRDMALGGIGVSDTGKVAYGVYQGGYRVRCFDCVAGTQMGGDFPDMPARKFEQPGNIPIPGRPGSICWDAATDNLYVADVGDGGTFIIPNGSTTRSWLNQNPSGPTSIGNCWNLGGANVWGTDPGDHAIWNITWPNLNTTGNNTDIWPTTPLIQLDTPTAMATDPATGDMWVVDEGMMCLRHCTAAGVWENFEYKPAAGIHMGTPRGVCFNHAGNLVVVDSTQVWFFTGHTGGILTGPAFPLPANLIGQVHSLAAPVNWPVHVNDVWFTDYQDHLYQMDGGGSMATLN